MPNVRIRIDSREIRDSIKALRREAPKALADALNKTAFEILDAEEIDVRGAFTFASPNTQRFLARGFAFDSATASNLSVQVRTKPGARTILERQQFGASARAGQPDVGPRLGDQVAIPSSAVKRGARGRIPVAQLPARLLRKNAKGRSRAFVTKSGKAVLERLRGGGVRFLYALAAQVRIKPTLDFFGTAERTARTQFPRKAARVLEKLNLRRGR